MRCFVINRILHVDIVVLMTLLSLNYWQRVVLRYVTGRPFDRVQGQGHRNTAELRSAVSGCRPYDVSGR